MSQSLRHRSTLSAASVCCLVFGVLPGIAGAQNDFFNTIDVDIGDSESDRPYSFLGWITQKVAYGAEEPGPLFARQEKDFNRIETSVYAQLDLSIDDDSGFRFSGKAYHDEVYRLVDHIDYSHAEVNEFRSRYEVRDFYYERRFDNNAYLKIGNQILAWGMSEYMRVTDLVNVEDQYTFAQQDLENLRLQVPAILVSVDAGGWVLDGVISFDADTNLIAPRDDEFDQFVALRNAGFRIDSIDADTDHEVFLRASRQSPNGDIQIIAGEYNDNALSVRQIIGARSTSPQMIYGPNRMRALGVAANQVKGSWLFFGEAGLHKDKAIRPNQQSLLRGINGWDEKDQLLLVAGAEYNGFRNLLVTVELDSVHTSSHDDYTNVDADQLSFGLRLYWTALNERLKVLGVMNELANSAGRVGRLTVDYDWSDNLSMGLMWVNYNFRDSSVFFDYRHNDVLQLQLQYNFQY